MDLLGSYFPAWMLCTVIGIAAAVIIRQILAVAGINDYVESHALAAPSATWADAAAKARYLILLFAETSEARYPRRQELISKVLDDLARLSD